MHVLRCRFISCVLLCVVLCSFLCLSAGASNTLGVIQTELEFLGVSFGASGGDIPLNPQYNVLTENSVKRVLGSMSDLSLVDQSSYFYFRLPANIDTFNLEGSVGLSTSSWALVSSGSNMFIHGMTRTGKNAGTITQLWAGTCGMWSTSNNTAIKVSRTAEDIVNKGYLYIIVEIRSYRGTLKRSLSFSESANISGTYSGMTDYSGTYFIPPTFKLKADMNLTDNTSQPLFQFYDSYMTVYPYSAGLELGTIDGTLESNDEFTQMMGHSAQDGTIALTSSGTSTASATSDVMAYGSMMVTYGGDGGLNDNILNQTDVIEQGNEDTQQAITDTAEDTQQAITDTAEDTQQAINDTAQATQDTITEETEKQTGAIGGFFETLLNGIKEFFTGLFIPEDIGTSAFTQLLEDKLGFIYQVPAMLLSFLGTMFSAFSSGGAQAITFPGWSFGGYTFMESYVIKRSDYQAIFDIIDPVFTIVGTILVVFAFCSGVKKLYNRILGGADNS